MTFCFVSLVFFLYLFLNSALEIYFSGNGR